MIWLSSLLLLSAVAVALSLLGASRLLLPSRPTPGLSNLPPAADLPGILVQLPVYNEEVVVERLLRCASRLRWPRDRLHIQLLDTSTDRTPEIATRVIAELQADGVQITHLRGDVGDGYKPGALARGHRAAEHPFIALFDADTVVAEDWLECCMRALLADPRAAFVQTRSSWINADQNWITRAQSLLIDAHFIMEQEGRQRRGDPITFDGSGAIWRRAAIDDAGGWSNDTMADDYDIALRAQLRGWHGVLLRDPVTIGECPDSLAAFRVQYGRWSNAGAQLSVKLLAEILRTDWGAGRKLVTALISAGHIAFPCIFLAVASAALHVLVAGAPPPAFAAVLIALAIIVPLLAIGLTLPGYIILSRGSLRRFAATAASVPLVYFYFGLANGLSVLATALGKKRVFTRTPKAGH